jgi:penicillin V acylase-like amidase (Ntn superfamily)
VPLDYLVADRSGAVAAVEFLNGRLVAHRGENLPAPALTNSTYRRSASYLASLDDAGREAPPGNGSLDRFARAAQRLKSFDSNRREAAFSRGEVR